jgi:membrane-associated phospholipid phosphatase
VNSAPPGAPEAPARTRRQRAARYITETFAPAHLVLVELLAVGHHSAPGPAGPAWSLVAAFFCVAVPLAVVVAGVRRGIWDLHFTVRRTRALPLVMTTLCTATGFGALLLLGAPRPLVALVAAMAAGICVTMLITTVWKISIHTLAASGACTVLALTYGPVMILAAPLVVLTAWSRVALRDHTPSQTIAGALLGVVIAATVFGGFRQG